MLADRVLVLRDGRISVDLPVGLPRRRRTGEPAFDALRARFLAELGVHREAASSSD